MLKVSEIFYSIQGEGPDIGRPAVFIRLSGCNLNCSWCDSKYHKVGKKMTYEQITRKIRRVDKNKIYPIIVITGGEPLLQQKELIGLISRIKKLWNSKVHIETNGTVPLDNLLNGLVNKIVISPKIKNSGNKKTSFKLFKYYKYIERIQADLRTNCCYKFVIQKEEDIEDIISFLANENIYRESTEKVYLMPEGQTKEEIEEKTPMVIELCKKYGFIFSTRLHILTYGDQRGV